MDVWINTKRRKRRSTGWLYRSDRVVNLWINPKGSWRRGTGWLYRVVDVVAKRRVGSIERSCKAVQ